MILNGQIPPLKRYHNSTLERVIAVMHQSYGVDISCYESSFLAKSLEKRRQATFAETIESYLEHLSQDRGEADELARSLRVTYSEFFRNPLSFAFLRQLILPTLLDRLRIKGKNEIRVWSSGCATGQEAWSVAILLDEISQTQGASLPFRIFATDSSEANLAIASAGVYNVESMGNVSLRHLNHYFFNQGESFLITQQIRDRVDFSHYDLLDYEIGCPSASIYGDFDLVLCCNVMLYYCAKARSFILNKLWRCLMSGGYLIIGDAERQIVEGFAGFRAVTPHAAVFQKRGR